MHSVAGDEAQNISGKDPDFYRRDLSAAIENGNFPEWELGVQMVPEEDEFKYDFDLLDATNLIPEELVPVQRIGKMTLNRNPDNFFAETERVAFHLGHIDAVYVSGGSNSVASLEAGADAVHFPNEAFKHCKLIAADTEAIQVIEATYFSKKVDADEGVLVGETSAAFIKAIKQHRFWERERTRKIPA